MIPERFRPRAGIRLTPVTRRLALLLAVAAVSFIVAYLSFPAVRHAVDERVVGGAKKSDQKGGYICPMHPFITSDHPGVCSQCGMALVPRERAASGRDITCSLHAPGEVRLDSRQRVMANVGVVRVARREFASETIAPGKVAWDERSLTRVSARMAGRIERLHLNFTGAGVRVGQPLLDIYAPDLVSAQREYLLALDGAQRAKESPSPESAGMMEGLRDAARQRLGNWGMSGRQIAELERTRQPKRVVTIHAPFAGIVTERLVTAGQYVSEGTPLFSLSSLARLWVFAELFEHDLPRSSVGSPAMVTTEAIPGKLFPGRVAFIDPSVNPETRTVRVRIDLDNSAGLLKPEMFVKVRLKGKRNSGLAVPEDAVLFSGERATVWVEKTAGVFAPRLVTVGTREGGFVEIVSGVSDGETIASSGGFLIDAESQLKTPRTGASGER